MGVLKWFRRSRTDILAKQIEELKQKLRQRSDFPKAKAAITQLMTCMRMKLGERKQRKLDYRFRTRQHVCRKRRKRRKPMHTASPTPTVFTDPHTVVNLSEIQLSPAEVTVLSSFCPTPPQLNTFQLQNVLEDFYRHLRLKEVFYDSEESDGEEYQPNPFTRRKKRWTPPKNREPALESYIQAWNESVHERAPPPEKNKDNLTREEMVTLKSLRNRVRLEKSS